MSPKELEPTLLSWKLSQPSPKRVDCLMRMEVRDLH